MALILGGSSILVPLSERFFGKKHTAIWGYTGCLERLFGPGEIEIDGASVVLVVGDGDTNDKHFFHPNLFDFLLRDYRDGPLWVQIMDEDDEIVVRLVDPDTHKPYPDEEIVARAPFAPIETKRIAFSLEGEPYKF